MEKKEERAESRSKVTTRTHGVQRERERKRENGCVYRYIQHWRTNCALTPRSIERAKETDTERKAKRTFHPYGERERAVPTSGGPFSESRVHETAEQRTAVYSGVGGKSGKRVGVGAAGKGRGCMVYGVCGKSERELVQKLISSSLHRQKVMGQCVR